MLRSGEITLAILQELSNDLAAAVERAGRSVVAVNGRPRTPSSGVHWRKGVVVTTDHTLRQDEDITITITGGTNVPAKIAGRDPGTDLAVLRADGLDSPDSEFADAASLKLGHIVLAVGRGLSASLGAISSVSGEWRTWRGGVIDHFIRPDVSIYTGFSGGALIDAQGRIVGINTSGLSRGGGVTVPAATVNRAVDELLQRGRVARGYLGVGMQPVRFAAALAGTSGFGGGLIVLSAEAGGPADKGGVMIGDVLVSFDGKALSDVDDLQASLGGDRIGKTSELKLVRGGQVLAVNVTIGERP
jgi:S1-C subfamily serine protease